MKQPKSRLLDALVRFRKLEDHAERQNLAHAEAARQEAETRRDEAESLSREARADQERLVTPGGLLDVSRYANAVQHGGEIQGRLDQADETLRRASAEQQAAAEAALRIRRKLDVTEQRARAHADTLERNREATARWESLDRWSAKEDSDV